MAVGIGVDNTIIITIVMMNITIITTMILDIIITGYVLVVLQ